MKILQIVPPWIPAPPPGYGGTELVIYNLCRGFVDLGHDVTLFATKNSQSPDELDYVFEKSLTEMDIDWVAALPPLVHYHQAFKRAPEFDIVHAHLSSGTDLVTFPFISDLVKSGVPAVVTIHGHWPYDRFSYMDSYYLKLYGSEIGMVNISRAMARLLPKQIRNAGVAYNSLDVDTLQARLGTGLRTKISTKIDSKLRKAETGYLTWLGKIVPDKGTHEAILAAKQLGEKFIFGGIVEKYDKLSVDYFKTKIKPLIDDDQVVYLGPLDLKAKNKLMRGAKAFLNPINWDEPFGMVMVESMACGTPVISYNRGAAPELIKNGKTGFLVKNRREMVKAIGKLDQINRKDCRKHVEEKFSPRAAAERHIEIYEREIARLKKMKKSIGRKLSSTLIASS